MRAQLNTTPEGALKARARRAGDNERAAVRVEVACASLAGAPLSCSLPRPAGEPIKPVRCREITAIAPVHGLGADLEVDPAARRRTLRIHGRCSLASWTKSNAIRSKASLTTRWSSARAQSKSAAVFSSIRFLPAAPARRTGGLVVASTHRRGAGQRTLQKVELGLVHDELTLDPIQLVAQLVGRLDFFKEATLEEHPLQREFPLMQRLNAPATVPTAIMRTIRSYREACRVCRQLSPRRHLKLRALADEAGLISQHCTDYFNHDDLPRRRDLPPDKIEAVEAAFGNTAISQWVASLGVLTVAEEMQADAHARRVAA